MRSEFAAIDLLTAVASAASAQGCRHARTVQVEFSILDFAEASSGLAEGNHVAVSDQDQLHPGKPVRPPMVNSPPPKGP
jgi:hypothetical protein